MGWGGGRGGGRMQVSCTPYLKGSEKYIDIFDKILYKKAGLISTSTKHCI